MKRKNQKQEEQLEGVKPTWRKTTLGALYPVRDRSVVVRQNETIKATVEELGNKINQFELVHSGFGAFAVDPNVINGGTIDKDKTEDKTTLKGFSIDDLGDDWYQVLKVSTGEVMNLEKLTLSDAEALKATLEAE